MMILRFFFKSEKANLAISLASAAKNEILGHMAFLDYPSANGVDPTMWEHWLKNYYALAGVSVSVALKCPLIHFTTLYLSP